MPVPLRSTPLAVHRQGHSRQPIISPSKEERHVRIPGVLHRTKLPFWTAGGARAGKWALPPFQKKPATASGMPPGVRSNEKCGCGVAAALWKPQNCIKDIAETVWIAEDVFMRYRYWV